MAQTKKSKKPETSPMEQLLDAAIENQSQLDETLAGVRKHGIKIGELVAEQVQQSQREALELTKKVASNPSDFTASSSLMMDAAAEAQNRALEFTKNLYNEQMEAAKLARESMESMLERSREVAAATMQLGNWWAGKNPITDAWEKGLASLRS